MTPQFWPGERQERPKLAECHLPNRAPLESLGHPWPPPPGEFCREPFQVPCQLNSIPRQYPPDEHFLLDPAVGNDVAYKERHRLGLSPIEMMLKQPVGDQCQRNDLPHYGPHHADVAFEVVQNEENAPIQTGSLGSAEAVLLTECGSDVVQALRVHYSALVAIADIATNASHIRAFLRHVASLQLRVVSAEAETSRLQIKCEAYEDQLRNARRESSGFQQQAACERRRGDDLRAEFAVKARSHEETKAEARTNDERLCVELERARGEVLRLGAQGMAQSQELAQEQAALIACHSEINRLRVELEVVGSMGRQQAATLEAERRRAAGADLEAEQATQDRIRAEAILKHTTHEQQAELANASQAAIDEAMRLRRRVEGNRDELQGVRKVLVATEATMAEIHKISPCTHAAAEFLRDPSTPAAQLANGPNPLAAGGPPPVRLPVLALRWAPGITVDTTPVLSTLRQDGVYGMLHQLQSGVKQPDQVELTVCSAHGSWFCAKSEEAPRFAALLLFQALHRDAPVAATCRVTPVAALPKMPTIEFAGLGVRNGDVLWRTPPLDDEDFFKALLVGSPLKEKLEQFFYIQRRDRVQEALQEDTKRNPVTSVTALPGKLLLPRHQCGPDMSGFSRTRKGM